MTYHLVTHSGKYHADDLIAYSILIGALPVLESVELHRSRDPKVWDLENAIVFDVGLEYNIEKNRYDHHQRGGAGIRDNGVPYAAAGLIWKSYGDLYIQNLTRRHRPMDYLLVKQNVDLLQSTIDEEFIQTIDAADNGASVIDSHLKSDDDTKLAVWDISSVLSQFNPIPLLNEDNDEALRLSFLHTSKFVKSILESIVHRAISKLVAKDFLTRWDKGFPILELSSFLPWHDYAKENEHIMFVIFPSDNGWRCQTVPTKGFENRKPLPKAWAGLTDEEFAKVSGVDDATFCANGRFICGAKSREGALGLAIIANSTID